jgi:tRNA G10  N-methylase Trm11
MNTYFSTFIPGFSQIIQDSLPQILEDVTVTLNLDGLIVYQTSSNPEKVKDLRFFNNTYILLNKFEKPDHNPIERMIYLVLQSPNLEAQISEYTQNKTKGFRVVISKENQNIRVKNDILIRLEERIQKIRGLSVNKSKASLELWFLSRDEGHGFFGIRITKPTIEDKKVEAGELKPELSHLLCLLSEPDRSDIFLDPFCGHGAIPLERASFFPYKQILTGDMDPKTIDRFRLKTKKFTKKIVTGRWDATNLHSFDDESITKIVTDPPWGFYTGKHLNLPVFYTKMLTEFSRVLKKDGITVILVAQKQIFETALKSVPSLLLVSRSDILVSGKKAAAYKIKKSN